MSSRSAYIPRFHDVVTMPVAERPAAMRVIVTEEGPLPGLIAYFLDKPDLSESSERKTAAAVGLLYDFYRAARPTLPEEKASFFRRFVNALQAGTIQPDGSSNPAELYWRAGSRKAVREVVRYADAYCDFCARVTGAEPLNPTREASFSERIGLLRRTQQQRLHALLSHIARPGDAWAQTAQVKSVRPRRVSKAAEEAPPHFPFAHTRRLIWEGFARGDEGDLHERYNVRDQMIAILQRFGGLRESEPFHLFVEDVTPVIVDPADRVAGISARVRVYVPSEGKIEFRDPLTGTRRHDTRAEYLREVYGRLPRDKMKHHPEHVGWKDLLLDDAKEGYAEVFWFPKAWGGVFWQLYEAYVRHMLPTGLKHPYLLVNLSTTTDGAFGAPYKPDSYEKALSRAVGRIGLESIKGLGTTSHGLRHAYAQTLRRCGVSEKGIQRAMHHKSIASQQVYTKMSAAEVRHELEAAHHLYLQSTTTPEVAATLAALRDPSIPAVLR